MKYKGGVMRGKASLPLFMGTPRDGVEKGRGTTDEKKNLPTHWQMNKESSCDE